MAAAEEMGATRAPVGPAARVERSNFHTVAARVAREQQAQPGKLGREAILAGRDALGTTSWETSHLLSSTNSLESGSG